MLPHLVKIGVPCYRFVQDEASPIRLFSFHGYSFEGVRYETKLTDFLISHPLPKPVPLRTKFTFQNLIGSCWGINEGRGASWMSRFVGFISHDEHNRRLATINCISNINCRENNVPRIISQSLSHDDRKPERPPSPPASSSSYTLSFPNASTSPSVISSTQTSSSSWTRRKVTAYWTTWRPWSDAPVPISML